MSTVNCVCSPTSTFPLSWASNCSPRLDLDYIAVLPTQKNIAFQPTPGTSFTLPTPPFLAVLTASPLFPSFFSSSFICIEQLASPIRTSASVSASSNRFFLPSFQGLVFFSVTPASIFSNRFLQSSFLYLSIIERDFSTLLVCLVSHFESMCSCRRSP